MAADITIDDLANPRLNDVQQAARQYGETLTVELNRHSIMAEAEATVGLSDWGDKGFVERLDLLCDEWNEDTNINGIGRLSLRNKLLQHATSRLLIQQQWSLHPEIQTINIEQPIIVAGLPRSGTTHLLNLMAADQRLRALPLWESYEPVPRPNETLTADGVDPRYQRCEEAWQSMQAMTPLVAAMHPMNPDHIHEELELMGPNFGSYNYEWLSHSPRWRDHYYSEDQTYQYEYMRDVLKLLTWQQRNTDKPTRWVLKCPQHLEQLTVLQKVFPDATVAITHRDPVAVIQSAITIMAYGQRLSRKQVMTEQLAAYWIDRVDHLLRACMQDRDCLPAEKSIDIKFKDLIQNDVASVEKIYQRAGLPMTALAEQQLSEFVEQHKEDYGRVIYDLEGQFGVNPVTLRQQFDFYAQRFLV